MASLIRIANLEKTYNITPTIKQEVLKGVNCEFHSGELVALLGESGCGKSTLINILGGLDTNYTGSVVIKGKFIRDYKESEMDDYRKKRVGLIFQHYYLIPHMTLLENVEISMEMSDVECDVRKERALDLLKLVGLDEHASKHPHQLSGGQKQRVAIARALANNPSIILADEPTGALDSDSSLFILNILKQIASSGKLVIIVTHSLKVASNCNRIVYLEDGVIKKDEVKEKIDTDKFLKYKEIEPKNIKTKNIMNLSKRNLLSNFRRSFLVSFGVSIGISLVILILCLSQGLTNYVKDFYSEEPKSLNITASLKDNIDDDLYNDVLDIEGITSIYKTNSISNMKYNYNGINGNIYSSNTIYVNFTPDILYGNIVNNDDEIIINETFALALSSEAIIASVGQTIKLSFNNIEKEFIIKGIFEDIDSNTSVSKCYLSEGGMNGFYESDVENANTLYISVKDITYLEKVRQELSYLSFQTLTFDDSSSIILSYIDLGTTILTCVSGISMIISSIMIIIVLYISVIERTQEIGILRSIGARKKDIRKIFIFEAFLIGLSSGLMGCLICLVLSITTNVICNISLGYTLLSYNPLYYLIGLGLTVLMSVASGIAPSTKASNLDPIEALRYE